MLTTSYEKIKLDDWYIGVLTTSNVHPVDYNNLKIECNKKQRKPENRNYIECGKAASEKAKKAESMAQAHVASENYQEK